MKAVRKAVNTGLGIQAGGGGSTDPLFLYLYIKGIDTTTTLHVYHTLGTSNSYVNC
jgi:hypothetical protein